MMDKSALIEELEGLKLIGTDMAAKCATAREALEEAEGWKGCADNAESPEAALDQERTAQICTAFAALMYAMTKR